MGIVLGFICLVCFLMLSAKVITRKCRLIRMDRFFMRIHKPISAALVIFVLIHMILVFPVLKNRNVFVSILGIGTAFLMIALIWFCHTMKDKKKRIHWHRILTAAMALCMAGHVIVYYMDFAEYQHKVRNIVVSNVDLEKVEDGTYEGEYDAGYIYAKVKVEIRKGRIVSIDLLEHRNERGKPAEGILDEVMEKQQIDVDVVSGATNSSKVIKKAIENAIK